MYTMLEWSRVYHNERIVEIDYLRNLRSFYLLALIIILSSAFIHDQTEARRNKLFILRASLSKRVSRNTLA